eukprot:2436541-Pleurochrysis_carterae.AAC.1
MLSIGGLTRLVELEAAHVGLLQLVLHGAPQICASQKQQIHFCEANTTSKLHCNSTKLLTSLRHKSQLLMTLQRPHCTSTCACTPPAKRPGRPLASAAIPGV